MIKIFSADQTRQIDSHTIRNEPVSSYDLMERASRVFADYFCEIYPEKSDVAVFAGTGNNGGDALAIARILSARSYQVRVLACHIGTELSPDCRKNYDKVHQLSVKLIDIHKGDDFPKLKEKVIIDGIFGSGLNRPVEGYWARLIDYINGLDRMVLSVDIPSGTFADAATKGTSLRADRTLSFEFPKLAFLFPENFDRVGKWEYRTIGLSQDLQYELKTPNYYVDFRTACQIWTPRKKIQHKGHFGHLCLAGGSRGKTGAMILAGRAALRSGVGLLSYQVPEICYTAIQSSVTEAMISHTHGDSFLDQIEYSETFTSYGIGCGMGVMPSTQKALAGFFDHVQQPIVLDADALNILAEHPGMIERIPRQSILTPHPKEFERLFGRSPDQFQRNELQRQMSIKLGIYIVLKGMHTCISDIEGNCYFNSTGNPGMATAGSGDVLTGVISSLLVQSYAPLEASILGVYVHGLAGDLAAFAKSQQSLVASDIIEFLPDAFKLFENEQT